MFPDLKANLITDAHFIGGMYREYHRCVPPLNDLAIGMVSKFPTDYMHSICLKVVRKLLDIWRNGNRNLHRFCPEKLEIFEMRTQTINRENYWPCEIHRRPRSVKESEHWKAVEFRSFLLYVSSLLFDILPHHIFCDFMLLRFAIVILLNEHLNQKYNEYAKQLMGLFVSNTMQIYGKECCVYNVHFRIHLPSDAINFGSLKSCKLFCF